MHDLEGHQAMLNRFVPIASRISWACLTPQLGIKEMTIHDEGPVT